MSRFRNLFQVFISWVGELRIRPYTYVRMHTYFYISENLLPTKMSADPAVRLFLARKPLLGLLLAGTFLIRPLLPARGLSKVGKTMEASCRLEAIVLASKHL